MVVTGASGMLGTYLMQELLSRGDEPQALSRGLAEIPEKTGTLYHLAGTEEDAEAEAVNLGFTRRLMEAFDSRPPRNMVYVSSWRVYAPDAGKDVGEDDMPRPRCEAGRTKARAEAEVAEWARRKGVTLTIVRPARMFGNSVHGDTLMLFNRATHGQYVHIRGNGAATSAVLALDCARAIASLAGIAGTYNISDGKGHRWIDLIEAMAANSGTRKRMPHLPRKWAGFIARTFPFLPIVRETLSEEALAPFSRTLVLSDRRLREALPGFRCHDTLAVIAREDKEYPYTTK